MPTNTPPNLQNFAQALIQKAGFDKLPENFKQGFQEQIAAEALNRMGMLVVAELSQEQLEEYGRLLREAEDPARDPKIIEFITREIKDFGKKFEEVLSQYADEFVEEAKYALGK